jgi:DNA-binding NarL/FixJ family response regulator
MGFAQANMTLKTSPQPIDKPIIIFVNGNTFELGCIVRYMEAEFGDHNVVGFSDVGEIVALSGRRIALTVIDLPTEESRSEKVAGTIEAIVANFRDTAIAVSTTGERADDVKLLEVSGLRGIFPTSLAPPVVAAIIRLIIAGGEYFPRLGHENCNEKHNDTTEVTTDPGPVQPPPLLPAPDIRIELAPNPAVAAPAVPSFTNRESQILEKLAEGLPNKLIAAALDMPENTVKVHIRNIMRKLKVTNRTAAVLAAQRLNVIAPIVNAAPNLGSLAGELLPD